MSFRAFAPEPALRPYVHGLCVVADLPAPGVRREIWPDSFVELVFAFGATILLEDADGVRPAPRVYRIGVLARPFALRALGTTAMVRAQLHAWAAGPLLGPAGPARGAAIRALDAPPWPALADAVERAIWAGDEAGAVATVQATLRERLARGPGASPPVLRAAGTLRAASGQVPIGALAARGALSPRQLERAFAALAGVAPKRLARSLRFERVRDALWQAPDTDLAALALATGHADQAHLTREFRAFTGQTPARLAARLRAGTVAETEYHG